MNRTNKFPDQAIAKAQELAPLGAHRENYSGQKEAIFGEHSAISGSHGAAAPVSCLPVNVHPPAAP